MTSRLILAIALQSLSPALLFGLSIVISRWWGAAEQGAFVTAKAWLDVLVAVGCFGIPQSVILAINRADASRSRLYFDACRYSALLVLVFVPVTMLVQNDGATAPAGAVAFALGAAGIVLNNIWRGILLTVDDGLRFHLITVVPALALALSVGTALGLNITGLGQSMAFACAAAGLLALLFSAAIFSPAEAQRLVGQRPEYRRLVTNGADAFVQALAFALQTYICYEWMRRVAGAAEAGRLSIALMAFQACVLPLQMVSPMMFNRWSRRPGNEALDAGRGALRRLSVGVACAIAAGIVAAPWVVPALLGAQFQPSVPAVQIVLLAVYPSVVSRIAGLRLAAVGSFRSNSISALVRIAVVVGALGIATQATPSGHMAAAAALCWLLGEAAAALATTRALRVRLREGAGIDATRERP